MAKLINQYIRSAVNTNHLRVMGMGLMISCIFQFIFQMKHIDHGQYGYWQACWYVIMLLPRNIYRIYPILMLFSALLAMSQLNINNELVTMRGNGVSPRKIMGVVIATLGIWIIIITCVGEWISPKLEFIADKNRVELLSSGQVTTGKKSVWIKDHDNYVHAHQTDNPNVLADITRYQFDQAHQSVVIEHAEKAIYKRPFWRLINIESSKINLVNNEIAQEKTPQQDWYLKIKPKLIKMLEIPIEHQSLSQLYKTLRAWNQYGHFEKQSAYIFWKRCFKPISTILLILMVLPICMQLGRKQSKVKSLVIAIIIGLFAFLMNEAGGQILINFGILPQVAAFLFLVCYAIIGVIKCCRLK